MHRIVASVTTLEQHFHALDRSPDVYRPSACPHCGWGVLWGHGAYYRKADRRQDGTASLNPVPICRYCCAACSRTCSRLPLCIAPRRWYNWAVQQVVLQRLLGGDSLNGCSRFSGRAQHTVRRWWGWLDESSDVFILHLRSRFPEWGRSADWRSFWRTVLERMSLGQAMAWLDRELTVP